jgi:tetratricopeptide (TPR) repeat protein
MEALDMFPADAVADLATTHNHLGGIYGVAGQFDTALRHFRESIRHFEAMQDRFGAGQSRFNAALALTVASRFADARDYGRSALRNFQACESADQEVVDTLKLLEEIESHLRANPPPS